MVSANKKKNIKAESKIHKISQGEKAKIKKTER